MKRLFLSAAALPLACAAAAHGATTINSATTAPVSTSTAASGHPDDITIATGGSITLSAPGAAVTVDSSNTVTNNGSISFNNVSGATGIQVNGGVTTTVTNAGAISVVEDYTAPDNNGDGVPDGAFAQGTGRYGIRVSGAGDVTGSIVNSAAVTVEGNDSAGVSVESRLVGSLASSGSVTVTGDRSIAVRADSVTGNVSITGAASATGEGATAIRIGDVGGGVTLQNIITATGYKTTTRLSDAARANLTADDLKQGGAAVRIIGSIAHGLQLAGATFDSTGTTTVTAANVTSYGAAPALDIGGAAATTLGTVNSSDLPFGIVNRGVVTGDGLNDAVSGTGVRIGQAGGGAVTVAGGLYNEGGGNIGGVAYGAQATGVLINTDASVPALHNAGTIAAQQNGGLSDARAIVDLSGTLTYLQNAGTIKAVVTPVAGVAQTGSAIAVDVSANTSGVTLRQTKVAATDSPVMSGDVRFGSGDDHLDLLAGTYAGAISFGAGADSLVVDGGATANAVITDSDGRLTIDVRNGSLSLGGSGVLSLTSLNVGAAGVLGVQIDPTSSAARLSVAGPATIASGAEVAVTLTGVSLGSTSYQLIHAQSLTVGDAGVSLAGAPWLYQANLRSDAAAGALYVDLRAKTAAELGLNRSGTEAYNGVLGSLNNDPTIAKAFLGQTTAAGFDGLYDQMLPDHSGGVLMSAAALSQAVSSAVARPMAIDKSSGTAMWAQEVVFDLKHDRVNALGYASHGFGIAGGADLEGERNALGVDVSFVTSDVKDAAAAVGEVLTMNMVGAGLYWRYDGGPLQAAARGGLGYAFLKSDRRLISPTLNLSANADWNGWMADAYAGASYELRAGSFYARPEVSASYVRLSEGRYDETGGGSGFDLSVAKRTGDLLTGQALLAVGWRFGDAVYFAPEISGGYRARLAGGAGATTAHFAGGSDFTLDPEDTPKSGAVVRIGLRGGAPRVLYELNGGATFDSAYKEYDVRALVRFQF